MVQKYLYELQTTGRSPRSVNHARQIAVAFMSWCVKTARSERNALKILPKLDETRDRRRVRRPLTDEELDRLLAVAAERGRRAWYLAALLAGLRRGDLERLKWADIDFEAATITIRHGKAKREDVVPLHPDLADEFRRRQQSSVQARDRVFPQSVTNITTQKDLLRAGIAREEPILDANGDQVLVGTASCKGRRCGSQPRTRKGGSLICTHSARPLAPSWRGQGWHRRSRNASCDILTTARH